MLVLDAGKTLQAIAGTNNVIAMTVDGFELSGGVETYKTLAQALIASAGGTIYTVPGSTQAFIKAIHLANTTAVDVVGVKLFVGGSAAANQITGSFTIPANGWAAFEENGWNIYTATGQLKTRVV